MGILMQKKILSIFLVMLWIPLSHATMIRGRIYDNNYNPIPTAKVFINTVPIQIKVTNNSYFEFDVDPGTYKLSSNYKNELSNTVTLEVAEDTGLYTVDLVLEPVYTLNLPLMIGIFAIILGISLLFLMKLKKPKLVRSDINTALPKDLYTIVQILKERGGRCTQKELCSKMAYSKAKVSLMVTDLEDRGMIKKIKKGRGNILVLK